MSEKFIPGPKGQALTDQELVRSAIQQHEERQHAKELWLSAGFSIIAVAIAVIIVVRMRTRTRRQKAK